MARKTFTEATDAFLKASEGWITPEDGPAVAALQGAAAALDEEVVPALLNSYGLVYRALLKRKPGETAEVDELESLLHFGSPEGLETR